MGSVYFQNGKRLVSVIRFYHGKSRIPQGVGNQRPYQNVIFYYYHNKMARKGR